MGPDPDRAPTRTGPQIRFITIMKLPQKTHFFDQKTVGAQSGLGPGPGSGPYGPLWAPYWALMGQDRSRLIGQKPTCRTATDLQDSNRLVGQQPTYRTATDLQDRRRQCLRTETDLQDSNRLIGQKPTCRTETDLQDRNRLFTKCLDLKPICQT